MALRFSITKPDDWHLHVRSDLMLSGFGGLPGMATLSATGGFARGLIMPNTSTPITTAEHASLYRDTIMKSLPQGVEFQSLMTIYLTDKTTPQDIYDAHATGFVLAAKLYPANATTGSAKGVTNIGNLDPVLQAMTEVGMRLCVHGELLRDHDGEIDIFHREPRFLSDVFKGMIHRHPGLRIVLEHITTEAAVRFVLDAPDTIAATITAHHLLENRNAIFRDGLNPHNYCLPILKKESDREWLVRAATSGNPKFFAGTDSAPHVISKKLSACGCAGCFTAPIALQLYATALELANALDRLEEFVSEFGAEFYGVPPNKGSVKLVREDFIIPAYYQFAKNTHLDDESDYRIVPFWAGRTIPWRIAA